MLEVEDFKFGLGVKGIKGKLRQRYLEVLTRLDKGYTIRKA